MKRRIMIFILFVLTCVPPVMGQTPEDRRNDTLRALRGVYFVVEELSEELKAAGLTTSQVHKDVELQLRRTGIHVMTGAEWSITPGKPFLYVRVSSAKDGSRHAFHLSVQLYQYVRLERYQEIAPVQVPTWKAHEEIGFIDAHRVQEIRSYIRDQVRQFTQAYLSVNPH